MNCHNIYENIVGNCYILSIIFGESFYDCIDKYHTCFIIHLRFTARMLIKSKKIEKKITCYKRRNSKISRYIISLFCL